MQSHLAFIDYTRYIKCKVLATYNRCYKVQIVGTTTVAYVSPNYVLSTDIDGVVKADKRFLKYF